MTELEKIAYAKSFIDKLAEGINPIDGKKIPDGEAVNNVRLSRCFFYVSDILRQVIENGGITPSALPKEKKGKKRAYYLLPEHTGRFEYSQAPITASEIFDRIIAVGPQEGVKRFPKRNLTGWLLSLGMIEEIALSDGSKRKIPTPVGEEIGISSEERHGQRGSYCVLKYNIDAQRFIIDNIEAVLSFGDTAGSEAASASALTPENHGKPWSKEQDERLVALFNGGLTVGELASQFGRGEKSIRLRLQKNGIETNEIHREQTAVAEPSSDSSAPYKEKEPQVNCQSCRFARSGECFPQKEICSDYEAAFQVPEDEKAFWPEMGDASYLRQKGKRR